MYIYKHNIFSDRHLTFKVSIVSCSFFFLIELVTDILWDCQRFQLVNRYYRNAGDVQVPERTREGDDDPRHEQFNLTHLCVCDSERGAGDGGAAVGVYCVLRCARESRLVSGSVPLPLCLGADGAVFKAGPSHERDSAIPKYIL